MLYCYQRKNLRFQKEYSYGMLRFERKNLVATLYIPIAASLYERMRSGENIGLQL